MLLVSASSKLQALPYELPLSTKRPPKVNTSDSICETLMPPEPERKSWDSIRDYDNRLEHWRAVWRSREPNLAREIRDEALFLGLRFVMIEAKPGEAEVILSVPIEAPKEKVSQLEAFAKRFVPACVVVRSVVFPYK